MSERLSVFEKSGKKQKVDVKMILLGESGVGKTCMIKSFDSKSFSADELTTIAFSFIKKYMNIPGFENVLVKLEIWDTIGQERYRSLAPVFFKDAKIGVLVYDISVKRSLTELKEFWGPQLMSLGMKDIILGVAGNKSDKFEKVEIPRSEGEAYAKEIGAIFAETSAAVHSGIDEFFQILVAKYLESQGIEKVLNEKKEAIKITKESEVEKIKEHKEKKKCC